MTDILPPPFEAWFAARGWQPRPHQRAVAAAVASGHDVLLISPTGGGKTLAGFLPSLIDLWQGGHGAGLHTLYASPLKALAEDIARNLEAPIREMGLAVRVETRTGDTPHSKRQRQRQNPPDILITTPEQISLMVADPHCDHLLKHLKIVILDELHALVASKRGALLSLALSRVSAAAPDVRVIGLSATVADPDTLRAWIVPQNREPDVATLVVGDGGTDAEIKILRSQERVPWAGHSARYAVPEIMGEIARARTALLFVNTRSQAEMLFQALWEANAENLPIALHHGSLDVAQRRKVEAAMGQGKLRAVVATSTLDMGIDWGNVDLVINVGAPKGSSRLLQRIGRSNHRLDEASRALLVPSNRFEVLECEAAIEAAAAGAQDTAPPAELKLDVLAQHVLGCACAGPFFSDDLFAEVRSAWPWRALARKDFDAVVDFVATGGYALSAYERYGKLRRTDDGAWRLAHPRFATAWRLNMGTIIEEQMLKVRLAKVRRGANRSIAVPGRVLGELEEYFLSQLAVGDTFRFAGEVLRFEGLDALGALATRARDSEAKVPSYMGGRFPLSTHLAARVRQILSDPVSWQHLPEQVAQWLELQRLKSALPGANDLLVETFPRAARHYLVCYPFEGRIAHQSLGMLLTRRLERAGLFPLGFVANDYALVIWTVCDLSLAISSGKLSLAELFDEDMLGDDLEAWLAASNLMKRTFRNVAMISGLVERRLPGVEKTARQMTVNTDLIFDVLRAHQPDHILLRAAWEDAAEGLIDVHRLGGLLRRIRGHILHRALPQVSPLAVPAMLEIGRESVYGGGHDALLAELTQSLEGDVA